MYTTDTELVDNVVATISLGKAAGINGLSAEHLIGPRCNVACNNIVSSTGVTIPWSKELRYLGVTLVNSCTFKCNLDLAKKSFYRTANAIFGKIGRIAPEEVILQLIQSKCIPVLPYSLEACHLAKAQLHSLDFVVNRFL